MFAICGTFHFDPFYLEFLAQPATVAIEHGWFRYVWVVGNLVDGESSLWKTPLGATVPKPVDLVPKPYLFHHEVF